MNTKLGDPLTTLTSGDEMAEQVVAASHQMIPRGRAGDTAISIMGEIVTAQRVAVPRVMAEIRTNIKALAAMSGSRWVYRIPFKNKRTGSVDYVEGPTIKCTNAVVRCYGNSLVTSRVIDNGDHWMIYARVVDLQTGSTYDRPYQQRKRQDTGMKDDGRALDMVFQIGVSKATRNVIANFLEDLVSYAVEEAKKGILERVGKNPEGARNWILEQLKEQGIEVKRVAAVYGRTPEHWTVPDMAKMFAEINSIHDGMVDADDIYPISQPQVEAPAKEPKEPVRRPAVKESSASLSGDGTVSPETGNQTQGTTAAAPASEGQPASGTGPATGAPVAPPPPNPPGDLTDVAATATEPRRRGRPKGSKPAVDFGEVL